MTALSPRFTEAVDYARHAHATQYRKGTQIPYLYHLLGVASLVLEHGGDEDQAIAGLLHDVLEDCGSEHEDPIRARFGAKVIEIVLACTDGSVEDKAAAEAAGSKLENWRRRKLAYLTQLRSKPDHTLLVSGCDKLHNARAILGDLEHPEVGSVMTRDQLLELRTVATRVAIVRVPGTPGIGGPACHSRNDSPFRYRWTDR